MFGARGKRWDDRGQKESKCGTRWIASIRAELLFLMLIICPMHPARELHLYAVPKRVDALNSRSEIRTVFCISTDNHGSILQADK